MTEFDIYTTLDEQSVGGNSGLVVDDVINPSAYFLSDGGSQTTTDLDPGSDTVTEVAAGGWDLTSVECSGPSGGSSGDPDEGMASIQPATGETVTRPLPSGRLLRRRRPR